MMPEDRSLVKVFEYALNQERTGLSFFENSLERLSIGSAVSAFERLIEEEKRHISFITSILEKLKKGAEIEAPGQQYAGAEDINFFDERAQKEFMEQCISESMVPDVTVFNTAWLIEKDLSEFYAKMAQKAEGKLREALEMLAKWEAEHERFFREYRDKLTETYSDMPWGG